MDVGGVSMAARVSFAVSQLGDVLVVGRPGTLAGVAAVPYYRRDSHSALTGLVTGMRAALDLSPPGVKPRVLVVGVDQPYVRVETLRFLLAFAGSNEAVVPVDDGVRQVTCGVYPSAWLDRAAAADDDDASLEDFLETVNVREIGPDTWRAWGEDGRSWFRVTGAETLEVARRRFGP
jgi:molybdopterin-guanine dinucleotide biosynthesis protein A